MIKRLFLLTLSVYALAGGSQLYAQPLRSYELVYSFSVPEAPQNAGNTRLWIPLASSREGQRIIRREIRMPMGYRIERDKQYGNEILYGEWEGASFPKGLQGEIHYWVQVDGPPQQSLVEAEDPKKYLSPTRFVARSHQIDQLGRAATEGKKTTWEKARGIYDYVIANMQYDKIAPGWGKGDSLRACSVGKGNCTDFHSLFIAMAQTASVPARFKIGLTVPRESQGEIPGYHCWAEYYDAKAGWVSIDASEAWKNPDRKEFYFGSFDADKFLVSVGRDIALEPQQNGPPVNIFFYPYLEVDGKENAAVQTAFRFKNV